jgi:hypothetical protein
MVLASDVDDLWFFSAIFLAAMLSCIDYVSSSPNGNAVCTMM